MRIMKRIFAFVIAAAICVLSLASCAADSVFVKYDDDTIGLHYELPTSLEYYKYGASGTYKNYRNEEGTVAVVISYFPNSVLAKNEAFGADVTLEGYLDYILTFNGLNEIVEVDYNDDKTRATYELSVTDEESELGHYQYYTLIRNEKGIYVVQMFCADGLIDTYAPQFIRWSNYIYAY